MILALFFGSWSTVSGTSQNPVRLQTVSETVMNHLVRGERAMEAGNLELAREIYEKALQEETNNCETTILNFILGVVF